MVLQWLYRTCVCCREEDEEEEDEDEDEEEEREAVDAENEDKAEEVEEVEVAVGEPVESPPVVGYTNKTKTTSLADKEEQHLVKTAADLVAVTELSQAVEEEKEGKGEEVEKEGAEKEQGEKEDGEEEEEEEEIAVSDVAQVSRTLWHHMWLTYHGCAGFLYFLRNIPLTVFFLLFFAYSALMVCCRVSERVFVLQSSIRDFTAVWVRFQTSRA